MQEESGDHKVYDEKAVSAILKRATELQASSRSDGGFGLSLAELQQIAAEAGIDPRFVAAAASETSHAPEPETNFWGGPLNHTIEWMVQGEIDDVAWEGMVAETRRYFKDTGEVRSWSNSKEWAHSGQNNVQAHVTATSRDNLTRIQIFWNEPTLAAATYVPLLVLSLISLPIFFEALALTGFTGAALYAGWVAILALIARRITSEISGRKKRNLLELKARLEDIVKEDAVLTSPASTAVKSGSSSLLDEPADQSETEGAASRRTRQRS